MTITLSPKFQIVIPKEIRENLKLKAGDKFEVFSHLGRIELVPNEPIESYEGRYKHLNITFGREPDREL